MALTPDLLLAERGLDELEQIEARALVWGLVDNALDTAEVDDALRHILAEERNVALRQDPACSIATARDLRELLVSLGMLFEVPGPIEGDLLWRTRMAEGVRLIARLRQLFPQHAGDTRWASAPTLVADYRFLRRARRYPKRDQDRHAVMAVIGAAVKNPDLGSAVLHWLQQLPPNAGMSKFQVDAAERILRGLEDGTRTGTLVSAGTGSGKTLAFYLPALAWLAQRRVAEPRTRAVRVLALYPRNELLKDQLAEVYEQCRKFDGWIGERGGSALRVGVLYGETPQSMKRAFEQSGWRASARESVCPFFRCPGCGGEMSVRAEDLDSAIDRLICGACGQSVPADRLAFTRKALSENPPDILFTSVEMLNRHLSNPNMRHVFGIGPRVTEAPGLVLMDEVHLYSGTYGAQVAFLMRRWWSASGRRSSFVGLSATIAEGKRFFAALTGMNEAVVQEIKPQEVDIMDEGAEYLLALRGDPVSQAALLSTTIQTLMLGARLLDPPGQFDKNKRPFFGWRAFAFTDQLDAANRLFRNLQDAEGRDFRGRPNTSRHPDGGLARLRNRVEPAGRRYEAGQDWRVVQDIGHDLCARLEIARTTAYDPGVSQHSEVVVATAALEVGFDDPAVGVVVQHKAPRDIASFLQRKGRAGRTRHMRPWTVVVLTDYGRDRLAYQAYDQLFDPELPPRQLPLANRYVQRMQSVYALLDELGDLTQEDAIGSSVWRDLSGPVDVESLRPWTEDNQKKLKQLAAKDAIEDVSLTWLQRRKEALQLAPRSSRKDVQWAGVNWLQARLRQRRLGALLKRTLSDTGAMDGLAQSLGRRLSIHREEMDVLLWNQPRPLLLGAIPTVIRRLASDWRAKGKPHGDYRAGHPLPEYVPASLFDDLSLPEMRLELPEKATPEYLPVQQGLGEFAPGKVSRRFDRAHWLGVPPQTLLDYLDADQPILDRDAEISDWYDIDSERTFHRLEHGHVVKYCAFRPIAAKLQYAPGRQSGFPEVNDTSNAQLTWSSHLEAAQEGTEFTPPSHIGISRLIKSVVAHTHAGQSAALVRRYAMASKADMRMRLGNASQRLTVNWKFQHDGHPCGIGFEIDSDALLIVLDLPPDLHRSIDWSNDARVRAARAARYNWEAQHCPAFTEAVPNPFLRGWIAQIFQIAAIFVARRANTSLASALDEVATGGQMEVLLSVLAAVFQLPEAEAGEEGPDRLRQALDAALRDDAVRLAVREAASVLVDSIDQNWEAWLGKTLRATLGAAFLDAIQQACPQVDPDGLIVDIDPGIRVDGTLPDRAEIWISETSPGGNGMIEQVVELLASRPDSLYKHVEAALEASDVEQTNAQMKQVIGWITGNAPDVELAEAVRRVRCSTSPTRAQAEFAKLRAELVRRGQGLFHGYSVALSLRLLRPNSPDAIDSLIAEIHDDWRALESRLGVEIDVRLVCAIFSDEARLDSAFERMGMSLPASGRASWRFGVLMGLLWPQGHALRAVGLAVSNRFTSTLSTERLLLEQWLTRRKAPIDPTRPGWEDIAREQLAEEMRTVFAVEASRARDIVPAVIRTLTVEPIHFEYLNVFATLSSVKRRDDIIELHFSIPESA